MCERHSDRKNRSANVGKGRQLGWTLTKKVFTPLEPSLSTVALTVALFPTLASVHVIIWFKSLQYRPTLSSTNTKHEDFNLSHQAVWSVQLFTPHQRWVKGTFSTSRVLSEILVDVQQRWQQPQQQQQQQTTTTTTTNTTCAQLKTQLHHRFHYSRHDCFTCLLSQNTVTSFWSDQSSHKIYNISDSNLCKLCSRLLESLTHDRAAG